VYNAYNGEMITALLAAFDKLAHEPLRVAVINGSGRNFQAGADINWLDSVRRSSPEDNLRASRMTAEAIQRLKLFPIPTIALVQGACFGGGTGVIAACDIVIAAENAIFSIAEVRMEWRGLLSSHNSTMLSGCAKFGATRSLLNVSTFTKLRALASFTRSCRLLSCRPQASAS
jgi:enoyl-CoA hydratase/carnithine racemase